MDDDIPIVATTKHIVVNTITAADDYLKMIQPSPSASPVYETNTYYSTVEFSKTISDDEITKVINTQDVITQVIVTESLPHGRTPMSMSHAVIDQSEDDGLSPSDYDDEPEADNYIKKTNAIDISPTRIDQKPAGNTAVPLHLYATKTYLTTFTYFTTLLQNADGNGGEILTTVDSHTRVIENVITESIATSMIPTDVLSSISQNLFEGEKGDLKTRITLNNGQKLEITAANILKPVDYATATKITVVESNDLEAAGNDLSPVSVALSSQESDNFVVDQTSSEEDIVVHQQQPIKRPTHNARPKPVSSNTASGSLKIPSLLNGISMPNFSALGPVINAMAGLLSNNFGSPAVTKVQPAPQIFHVLQPQNIRPVSVEHENLPHPLPLFSQESQDMILSQTDSKNTHPLYIPVRGDRPNNGGATHHHHSHHASMMGSGIAISPGEVITANSDVIVGRPAVIGPQLPPNINKPVEIVGMEAPPPFVPLKTPQRPSSFVKDIKSNGNINFVTIKKGDDYVGPVPPKEIHIPSQQPHHNKQHHQQSHKQIPINSFPRQPAPQNLQKIQPIIPPMMRPPPNENNGLHQRIPHNENNQNHQNNFLPKPAQETQINNHFVKINQQVNVKPNVPSRNQNRNQFRDPESPNNSHHNNHPFRNQSPHNEHHSHHQHHQHRPQNSENVNYANHHQPHLNQIINPGPNVIEIQKIPEVYSTDLPIITVNNQHLFQPSSGSHIITHELPEILDKPSRGQPLLVDIQPSQVANVVIPHGSSSILVYGGVHEAHKAGQYFNDPAPHGNAEFGIKSVNLFADVEGSKYQGSPQNQNHGPKVHYDEKDNIIVASENVLVPSVSGADFNLQVGNSIRPTISRPPPDFISHSVNVVPNSVIRFHPDSGENYNRPTTQQLINQQKQQQIQIDQQLRQKQIENQKRVEIENKKHQEFLHHQKLVEQQKRKEFEDQRRKELEEQKRKEYEEQQHLKKIEHDRQREYERQKQLEFEQRQKQIEQQKRQQEIEQQKRIQEQKIKQQYEHEQKLKQQYEHEQKIQKDMQLRQQFEQHQKWKIAQQQQKQQQMQHQQQNLQQQTLQQQQHQNVYNLRPNIVSPQYNPIRPESHKNSGFIVLTSNYNQQSHHQPNQQGPFVPLPSQSKPAQDDSDNDTDGDGPIVQESVNRPKLPSGENLETLDDDVKIIEEYDNFVYHQITASSTELPTTTTTQKSTTTQPPTTRRSSYIPISTEKFVPTSERIGPVFVQKLYPNLQFDNLPKSVNELQANRPQQNKYQRVPTIGSQFKPNYNVQAGNTLSQSMQPPAPPKNPRRPTSPNKTTFKISMPINPMPDDTNVLNNLQTEEPFNPKYTEDFTTKPSLTTKIPTTTTVQSTTERTTEKVTTTEKSSTHATTSTRSDLNIGEVEAQDRNKTQESEDADIFDSKESVNPLNHGFVKHHNDKDDFDLRPPSIRKPYQTIVRSPETTTFKTPGIKLEISSIELENMKPPAPGVNPTHTTRAPAFEEIVNMKPPATTHNKNHLDGAPVKPPYVNIQRPTISLNKYTPSTPSSYVTPNQVAPTTGGFKPAYGNRLTTKKPDYHTDTFDIVLQVKQGEKKEVSRNNDEIIIGSVEAIENEQTRSSINATPVFRPESSSRSPSTRVSISVSSSVRQPSSFTRSRIPISAGSDDKKLQQNRTKTFPDPIKVSTKYITNTKTITLAKTKTEVINRSHGTPVTTTRVQTETVYETITETETLLKPTVISSIHPTSTMILPIVRKTLTPSHPTTTEEIIEGFVSDEDIDEFIINYDDDRNDTTINRVNSGEKAVKANGESIFVVMSDKKKGSVFNIDPAVLNPSLFNHTESNEIDDVSRGEEDNNNGADQIILGGIFISSPPQLDKSLQGAAVSTECLPECISSKNEYCHRVLGQLKCICRPGFARMFLDRPCKRKTQLFIK